MNGFQLRKLISDAFLSIGFLGLMYIAVWVPPGRASTIALLDVAVRCLHFGAATALALQHKNLALGAKTEHLGGMLWSWVSTILAM